MICSWWTFWRSMSVTAVKHNLSMKVDIRFQNISRKLCQCWLLVVGIRSRHSQDTKWRRLWAPRLKNIESLFPTSTLKLIRITKTSINTHLSWSTIFRMALLTSFQRCSRNTKVCLNYIKLPSFMKLTSIRTRKTYQVTVLRTQCLSRTKYKKKKCRFSTLRRSSMLMSCNKTYNLKR